MMSLPCSALRVVDVCQGDAAPAVEIDTLVAAGAVVLSPSPARDTARP